MLVEAANRVSNATKVFLHITKNSPPQGSVLEQENEQVADHADEDQTALRKLVQLKRWTPVIRLWIQAVKVDRNDVSFGPDDVVKIGVTKTMLTIETLSSVAFDTFQSQTEVNFVRFESPKLSILKMLVVERHKNQTYVSSVSYGMRNVPTSYERVEHIGRFSGPAQ